MGFLNKIIQINFRDIIFCGIEKFQDILEYNFYLINFIGICFNNLKYDIFIKKVKKGKIKESLFCICDLFFEKYLKENKKQQEKYEKPKKISILESKNSKIYNKVIVSLFANNLNQEDIKIEIIFVQISKTIRQTKNYWKGWKKYVDLNDDEVLIVGIKK